MTTTGTAKAVEQEPQRESFTAMELQELLERFRASGFVILPVLESMVASMFKHNMPSGCIREALAMAAAVDLEGHAAALDKERGLERYLKLPAQEREFLSKAVSERVGDALHGGLDWERRRASEKVAVPPFQDNEEKLVIQHVENTEHENDLKEALGYGTTVYFYQIAEVVEELGLDSDANFDPKGCSFAFLVSNRRLTDEQLQAEVEPYIPVQENGSLYCPAGDVRPWRPGRKKEAAPKVQTGGAA